MSLENSKFLPLIENLKTLSLLTAVSVLSEPIAVVVNNLFDCPSVNPSAVKVAVSLLTALIFSVEHCGYVKVIIAVICYVDNPIRAPCESNALSIAFEKACRVLRSRKHLELSR